MKRNVMGFKKTTFRNNRALAFLSKNIFMNDILPGSKTVTADDKSEELEFLRL